MKKDSILKYSNIYFVGIGGISMSGLVQMCLSFGLNVSGSDVVSNAEVEKLAAMNIAINIGHNRENIHKDIDLLVYTSAVSPDNVELLRARELGVECVDRAEFLGAVATLYKSVIAISGTHGKTTTTAMIGEIFALAGENPTIHLGGESVAFGSNTVIGSKDYFIVEACEYKESFRYLKPDIAVITNIEADHLDYYKSYSAIVRAFQRFADSSKSVVAGTGADISHHNIVRVGSDWEVKQIEFLYGGYNFNVYYRGRLFDSYRLNMLGVHNVSNALFAISVAHACGIAKSYIQDGISSFAGVERRYERIFAYESGCKVIIDYAHHPTELSRSIEGICGVYKRVLYVFQPHTFSRTKSLADEFVAVLEGLEHLVVFKTYPAREEAILGGSAYDLYTQLDPKKAMYLENIDSLLSVIDREEKVFDCVLVLGAGDLAEKLKKVYKNRQLNNDGKIINYC